MHIHALSIFIDKNIDVKCSGFDSSQKLNVLFNATQANSNNDMVMTSNPDVGIKILNKAGNEISVHEGVLPIDVMSIRNSDYSGSFTFSASPVSLTGNRLSIGEFTATATLTFEFIS